MLHKVCLSHASTRAASARRNNGTSIIESLVAALVILPIALAIVDLIALVVTNTMNDNACKNAARAAANQSEGNNAFQAANKALAALHPSPLIKSIKIDTFDYQQKSGVVTVITQVVVHPPVPVPGYGDIVFKAKDVEPIVSE